MRAIVIAAAVLGCLCGPSSAYDFETKKGQAVCDTLAEFEELSIAIGMQDDRYIEEMGNKGCHFPEPGMGMTLLEAYADQTVLLFRKLADNTRLGPVPEHIDGSRTSPRFACSIPTATRRSASRCCPFRTAPTAEAACRAACASSRTTRIDRS